MFATQTEAAEPRQLMVNEARAADLLGFSRSTLALMAMDGEIPFVQVYRRRFYVVDSLRKWVAEKETPSNA